MSMSCHKTNSSKGGFRKESLFPLLPFLQSFFFLFPFCQDVPIQLDVHFSRCPWPASLLSNNTHEKELVLGYSNAENDSMVMY